MRLLGVGLAVKDIPLMYIRRASTPLPSPIMAQRRAKTVHAFAFDTRSSAAHAACKPIM